MIGTPPSEYATFTGSSVFRQGIRRSRTTVQADDATNAEETGGTGASGGGSRGRSFIRFTRRQRLVHLSTRLGQGDAWVDVHHQGASQADFQSGRQAVRTPPTTTDQAKTKITVDALKALGVNPATESENETTSNVKYGSFRICKD